MSVKLNKSSKVKPFTVDTKAADLSSLSAENAVLKAGLENTVSMVNYFGSAIETQAIKLEALKLPTKLTLGWIIMNRKKFFEFVELIIHRTRYPISRCSAYARTVSPGFRNCENTNMFSLRGNIS